MATKQIVTLAVVLGMNFLVDLTNARNILIVRVLYGVMTALGYLAYQRIAAAVEAKRDVRVIWVKKASPPNIMAMFSGEPAKPAEYEQTTYYDHEKAKAAAQLQQALMTPLIQFAMSMYMSIHLPCALGCVTAPMQFLEDPLFRMYILGQALPRPWEELDAAPEGAAVAVAAEAAPAAITEDASDDPEIPPLALAGSTTSGSDATPAAAADIDAELEEVVIGAWESVEAIEPAAFEALAAAGKPVATYATQDKKWTALMVTAGHVQHPAACVTALLRLGAVPEQRDAEGWSALMWAGFHNNAAAVNAICEHVLPLAGGDEAAAALRLEALLQTQAPDGCTPLRIATKEDAASAAAALQAQIDRAAFAAGKGAPGAPPAEAEDAAAAAEVEDEVEAEQPAPSGDGAADDAVAPASLPPEAGARRRRVQA